MMKIKELNWPANSRMDLLAEVLDEKTLLKLVFHFYDKSEELRKIRMPKRQTILKLIAFYYGSKVARRQTSWDEVMKSFRDEFGFLKNIDISRKRFKQLYKQRMREIFKEQ